VQDAEAVVTDQLVERRTRSDVTATVRLERATDDRAWDALVEALTPEPAFHRSTWLDLITRINGLAFERFVVLVDDAPVGVLPVPRESRLRGAFAPFPYLGPLVPEEHLADTVAALRRWQRQTGLLTANVEFAPGAPASTLPTLADAGLQVHEDSTVLLDVSHGSVETLRAGYSSLRRRDIRRAVRDGSTVRDAQPGEVATLLPQVLDEAFTAHGKPSPYDASVGERVEEWAAGRDDVGLFTALVDGEPAGVQVVIGAGEVSMAWAGACLRRFRDANPNVLLYDRLLEWSVERGYRTVDLCGRVDEGVLKYKLAFGGEVVPYTVGRSAILPQPLLSAAGRARRLVRR
jgi:hypothetical protein